MIKMMIARGGVVAALFVSTCPVHAAVRMLAEVPVATTSVGFDTVSKRYATRVIAVGIGIPAERSQDEADAFALCAADAAWAFSTEIRGALGLLQDEQGTPNPTKPQPLSTAAEAVAGRSTNPTAEDFNRELNARATAIGTAVSSQLGLLRAHLHNGCGSRVDPFLLDVQVAFTVRACMSRRDDGICDEFVSVVSKGANPTAGFTPSQFDKLYAWLTLAQARDINVWFILVAEKPTEFTAATVVREVTTWPTQPSATQAVEQLENLIDRLRATKKRARKLSYLTPRLVNLSRESLAHVVDVVDHPFAAALLVQETGGQPFTRISDEIARSRIMDCARLHGSLVEEDGSAAAQAAKTPLERVASCAGVETRDDVLLACLTGGHCLPARSAKAIAALMSIQSALDARRLATATYLPRIGRAVASIEAYEALGRQCAAGKTPWDQMNCVLKGSMSAKDYELVGCVQVGTKIVSDPGSVMDCAMAKLPGLTDADRKRMNCFRSNAATPAAALGCAALPELPQELQAAYACTEGIDIVHKNTIPTACGAMFGTKWGDVATCIASADTNSARLWCAAKPNLPADAEDVVSVVECAGGDGDWKKYAACGIQQKIHLKGTAGQALSCGIANGGVNLGTAVCMANLSDHLTQDQAIVLQCASSSPDLTSFAACAGGQMTINFLVACKKHRFGSDDGCFGPNNEIRRALRAVGLEGIVKKGSPIATYMDAEVSIVWLQYSIADKGLRGLGSAVNDVGHGLEKVGQAVGKGAEHLIHEGRKVVCRVLGC